MNATTSTEPADRPAAGATADGADPEGHLDAAPDDGIEKDELFHLLKSERRRRAIRYLLDADEEPVRMRTLAEAVAATEYDTTVDALSSDERQRVYITLYQSHLPQLDRAGVIDYNQSRGRITTNPLIEEFDPYLDTDDEETPARTPWWRPATAGFTAGAAVALAAAHGTGALGTVGTAVAGVVVLVAMAVALGAIVGHRRLASDNGIKDRSHKPASTN